MGNFSTSDSNWSDLELINKKLYEVVLKNDKLFPSLTLSKLQFSLALKYLFFHLFLRSFSENKKVHMSIISEQCIYLYSITM